MSMTTREGELISFSQSRGKTVMTVSGDAEEGTRHEVVELNLTVDDLMDLQNELYVALHNRPDPEITAARADDERIKRLVKEAFAELVGGQAAPQFVQNNFAPQALSAEDIYRSTGELFADMIGSWLYGSKPGEKRPKPSSGA